MTLEYRSSTHPFPAHPVYNETRWSSFTCTGEAPASRRSAEGANKQCCGIAHELFWYNRRFQDVGQILGYVFPPFRRRLNQIFDETGLLPILQWMISMERNPPPTRALLTIERLQGWSMLAYYPLEHLYYLRAHSLIPATIPSIASLLGRTSKRIHLSANSLAMWSCRAWAVYVILQFAHLMEDRKLLLMKEKTLRQGKGVVAEDKEDLRNKWDSFWNEVVANSANLPLALHW